MNKKKSLLLQIHEHFFAMVTFPVSLFIGLNIWVTHAIAANFIFIDKNDLFSNSIINHSDAHHPNNVTIGGDLHHQTHLPTGHLRSDGHRVRLSHICTVAILC